jgi:hypothetical protein
MGCTGSTAAAGGAQGNYKNGSKHTSAENDDFDKTEREGEPSFVVGRTHRVYKTKPNGGKGSAVGEEKAEVVLIVDGRQTT